MSTEIQTVETTEIEQERNAYLVQAQELQITDHASYGLAGEFLKEVKGLQKKIDQTFDPHIDAAHKAHKALVATKKSFVEPLQRAEAEVKVKAGAYYAEVERKRREEQQRLERERQEQEKEAQRKEAERQAAERKRLEEERLAEAAELEAQGLPELAEMVVAAPVEVAPMAAPAYIPPPPAPAPAPKVDGISYRDNWKAEVVDLLALVKAVAAGQQPITLLQANQTAINQMAKALKGATSIPGVRVFNERVANVRA